MAGARPHRLSGCASARREEEEDEIVAHRRYRSPPRSPCRCRKAAARSRRLSTATSKSASTRRKATIRKPRTTATSSTSSPSGSGNFRVGDRVDAFAPGALLYVAARETHRFEDFTDDFAAWVVFYGPIK